MMHSRNNIKLLDEMSTNINGKKHIPYLLKCKTRFLP